MNHHNINHNVISFEPKKPRLKLEIAMGRCFARLESHLLHQQHYVQKTIVKYNSLIQDMKVMKKMKIGMKCKLHR